MKKYEFTGETKTVPLLHPSSTVECILLDMLNEIKDINVVKKESALIQERVKQKKVG